MTVYLDSSTILRRLLQQPGALAEWRLVRNPIASRLTHVECFRTLDRLRVEQRLTDEGLATLRGALHEVLARLDVIEVTRSILARAAQPSATSLGTLDAIHLASALAWRDRAHTNPALGTHDAALAMAARANGFRVVGA